MIQIGSLTVTTKELEALKGRRDFKKATKDLEAYKNWKKTSREYNDYQNWKILKEAMG